MDQDAAGASRMYQRGCELLEEAACDRLGRLVGYAGERERLRLACEAGAGAACAWAGAHRVSVGEAGGVEQLERACALGHAAACSEVATSMLTRSRVGNESVGRSAWQRACEGGVGSACWSLGAWLAEGNSSNGLSAYDVWVVGCQRGSRESCYAAAQWEKERGTGGLGVPTLLGASCSGPRGELHWNGCLELAAMLERGVDGRGAKRASELYEWVCDMKIRGGCLGAARMAEKGVGGAVDEVRAARLYGRGCGLGDTEACLRAGAMGGSEGAKWYEEGCNRFKHAPSCERVKNR